MGSVNHHATKGGKNLALVNLRAIGILLVVLGHSMILFDRSWGVFTTVNESVLFFNLKQVINIFQMPIFFFISGFLFYVAMEKKRFSGLIFLFQNKVKKLLIPFLVITIFWMVPIRLAVKYAAYQGNYSKGIILALTGSDAGHMWFLPTLFIIFILTYWFLKTNDNKKSLWILIVASLVYVFSSKVSNYFFGRSVCTYLVYFVFGYYFSILDINKYLSKKIVYLPALALVLTGVVMLLQPLEPFVKNIFTLIIALTGVALAYVGLEKKNSNFITTYLSDKSFEIYLFHSPIIYIIYYYFRNLNPILLVCLNVFVSIGCSIIIATIIKKLRMGWLIGSFNSYRREPTSNVLGDVKMKSIL